PHRRRRVAAHGVGRARRHDRRDRSYRADRACGCALPRRARGRRSHRARVRDGVSSSGRCRCDCGSHGRTARPGGRAAGRARKRARWESVQDVAQARASSGARRRAASPAARGRALKQGVGPRCHRACDTAAMVSGSRTAFLIAWLALTFALEGCSVLAQLRPSYRAAEERAQKMQELQLRVMRFADGYVGRVREATSAYQASAVTTQARLDAQEWKVQQSNAAYTIASGSNPFINTLDIVVLATLSRMVIDDVWMDAGAREQAQFLRDTHTALERDAWHIVEDVLD